MKQFQAAQEPTASAGKSGEVKADSRATLPSYVLITPARNEEAFIEKTIESMIHQTVRPVKWVIVNDGSTDSTGAIAARYAANRDWIEVVNRPVRQERHFAAKVHAFNAGWERVKGLDYEVIGNLDADISFEEDHFEFLMARFAENPRLGVAGTIFKESSGYSSETHSFEGKNHVSGQCQLFRRECFDDVGGYVPIKEGGIDWVAVTTARMMGWKTQSFREKSFFHHRVTGTAIGKGKSVCGAAYHYGYKDYCMGAHPVWQMFRIAYRMTKRPYFVAGVALGAGYFSAVLQKAKHPISKELIAFYRREQMQKLGTIVKSLVTLKKVDKFSVSPQ